MINPHEAPIDDWNKWLEVMKQFDQATVGSARSVAQLEDALDRAALLSRIDRNNLVRFEITDKVMLLTSKSDIGDIRENITISKSEERFKTHKVKLRRAQGGCLGTGSRRRT